MYQEEPNEPFWWAVLTVGILVFAFVFLLCLADGCLS